MIPLKARNGRTEIECMNALQNHGVISDNCVWWADVGWQSRQKAILWLEANPDEK